MPLLLGDQALLRAERSGRGNGRMYHVDFTAIDEAGASCQGSVRVAVPLNMKPGNAALDEGAFSGWLQP